MNQEKVLELNNMKTHFNTENGKLTALDNISFSIRNGEILGVVGESGCGKSALANSIMQLHDKMNTSYDGEVIFDNKNLLDLSESEIRKIRGNQISMIFQDPMSSLDPLFTVGDQIIEAIRLHQNISIKDAKREAIKLLELTGMPSPEKRVDEYPHQLSGGMRQRILIAIALACNPKLLIADEPTTALDVTIQAQILDLIKEMNRKLNMGIMFITHDLGVVAELCDNVMVMYLGQVVEKTTIQDLFKQPLHPYTKGLLRSVPNLESNKVEDMYTIEGTVPALDKIPLGCRFASRCPFADELCHRKNPELKGVENGHKVRCWHYKEILAKEVEDNECYEAK